MNKLFKSVSILAAAAVILPSLAGAEAKSIYGDDNRLDYFEAPAASEDLARKIQF